MLPSLFFTEGGWCEAIKASYAPGNYQPKSRDEYLALAPFAVDAPELEPEENTGQKSIDDMKAGELIAYAQEHDLDIGGLVPQAGKEKILAAVKAAIEAKA